jgi:hypothetical protein
MFREGWWPVSLLKKTAMGTYKTSKWFVHIFPDDLWGRLKLGLCNVYDDPVRNSFLRKYG